MEKCSYSDKIVEVSTKVEKLEDTIREEGRKHENYRKDNHDRMNDIHTRLSLKDHRDSEKFTSIDLEVSSLKQTYLHQDEALKEFKDFIMEAKKAFKTMNDYMLTQTTRNGFTKQLILSVVKLAGFAGTMIGIIKYLGIG